MFSNSCFKALTVHIRITWLIGISQVGWNLLSSLHGGAVLTLDKVTPTAVEDVFTIWITGIIPLLFGNMLPESGPTSAVTRLCDQSLCRAECVCARSCVSVFYLLFIHTEMIVLLFLCI